MSQRHLVLVLAPLVTSTMLLAASCGEEAEKASLKPGSGKIYQQPKDAGAEASADAAPASDGAAASSEAGQPAMPKDIANTAQALQVVLVAYDAEIQEGAVGKFESQGAMNHLNYVLPKMFNDTFINRRIATANGLLRALDEEIIPVVGTDDEELRSELDTVRSETESRLSRAEAVKSGLSDPGSSAGMFDESETPAPPRAVGPSDAGK